MKKLFAIILCVCLVFGLAACGAEGGDKKDDTSAPTASSLPAIGTEIGSESADRDEDPESSEEASSEEEPFDPYGDYDTGKDPFMNQDGPSEYVYENGFEEDDGYVISGGFEKFTADKSKIHGGKASLHARSESFSEPDFYVSIPDLMTGAECELTVYLLCESATDGTIEILTTDSGAADVSRSLSGMIPGQWNSVTVTFNASTADIHVKAPAGVSIFFDDLTVVYRQ